MSEDTQTDLDRRPPWKRATDLSDECIHNGEFLDFELGQLEIFLKLMGNPKGKKKTKLLATLIEEHGEAIRRDYCLNYCQDPARCRTGEMYLNQRARRLSFPLPPKYEGEKI